MSELTTKEVAATEPNITESAAVCLYLTDKLPANGIGPVVGDALRGPYVSWLAYNAGVIEPVMAMQFGGLQDNAVLRGTFRGRSEMLVAVAEAYFADYPDPELINRFNDALEAADGAIRRIPGNK